MFPIFKSNNNIFLFNAKMMTSLDITVTNIYINCIKYLFSILGSHLSPLTTSRLPETSTLFLRLGPNNYFEFLNF